jgi:hypothetical protein
MNAPKKPETIRIGERDVPLRDCWSTPKWLVDRLDERWCFGLDAAATVDTAIRPNGRSVGYLGPDHPIEEYRNALDLSHLTQPAPWAHFSGGLPVFVNCPYSQNGGGLTAWVDAFIRESQDVPVVAILPDTPSCRWWRRAFETAAEVTLFDGRVRFDPPPGVKASSPRGGAAVFAWVPRIGGPARVRWESVPGKEAPRG